MDVRVLVVDDQPQLRTLVRRFFALDGAALAIVAEAESVAAAVAAIAEVEVDVAIVDANLPDGNGIDLAAALRAVRPGLRIVLFTGHVDDAVRREADAAGIEAVVSKDGVGALAQAVLRVALG